jgi:hypothetical protein
MSKYLFRFKTCSILVNAENKSKAIVILQSQYNRLFEDDFEVIAIEFEIDEKGMRIENE